MIVLDASTAVDYIIGAPTFERIHERLHRAGEDLHAPHLLDLEVTQALRRLVLKRDLAAQRADAALSNFGSLRLKRYPHLALLARVWDLRQNLSVFDAAYVALAEALDAPLITTDARLSHAAGHRARIELME